MIVNISDYGDRGDKKFIEYSVSGLSEMQLDYLKTNLNEDIVVKDDVLTLTMHFKTNTRINLQLAMSYKI